MRIFFALKEPGDVDPDLRSISPISTRLGATLKAATSRFVKLDMLSRAAQRPGVFPWQAGKKATVFSKLGA